MKHYTAYARHTRQIALQYSAFNKLPKTQSRIYYVLFSQYYKCFYNSYENSSVMNAINFLHSSFRDLLWINLIEITESYRKRFGDISRERLFVG